MQDLCHLKNRVMNDHENISLLKQCPVGRIATISVEGIPFITQVNYVYEEDTSRIYIHHSSRGGQLLANLRHCSHCCIEIDQPGEIVNIGPGRHICDTDQAYRSVICLGRLSIAQEEEKTRGLRLLGNKYTGKQTDGFDSARLDRLVVLVMDIEKLSGKCREPKAL
jgi:uncharacterized protein